MARYTVGFDGRWQESFDDLDEASTWAQEVATTGRTVEVIGRRFGFARFITAFPESEREALAARWRRPGLFGTGLFAGGEKTGSGHRHHSTVTPAEATAMVAMGAEADTTEEVNDTYARR
jgi:hypothetical protein